MFLFSVFYFLTSNFGSTVILMGKGIIRHEKIELHF